MEIFTSKCYLKLSKIFSVLESKGLLDRLKNFILFCLHYVDKTQNICEI